ncbi:unnamed protein product [Cylindrotheca closterium]|uniref:Uncharacterized protein n=1 Tax=Cylindrotheca closterium TaxID=2856 RepID=A0AAD2FYM9_9STRA|nr:unnamed protein product [Cylindrotheca closterium]
MTIKGPNAHNYNGGLGELLGWGQATSRYDYADDYDVEAHRRHLYEQHMQKQQQNQQQQQYTPQYNNSGFSNALSNPSRPNQTQLDVGGNENDAAADTAAGEAVRKKLLWEKRKKQATNLFAFIIILVIWLASGSI